MSAVVVAYATASEQAQALKSALSDGSGDQSLTGFAGCLTPLLIALKWRGDPRLIADALPHFVSDLDLVDFRNVLGRLGYRTRPLALSLNWADERLFPFLFVSKKGTPYVVLGRDGGNAEVFDSETGTYSTVPAKLSGTAYVVDNTAAPTTTGSRNWFGQLLRRFSPIIAAGFAISAVINLCAVAVPLGIMAIYDQVMARQNGMMLFYILAGVGIGLASEYILKRVRAYMQAHIGGRLDYLIGAQAFDHILHLPPTYTEQASLGGQVASLREFESLRDVFTSPLAGLIFDLPFTLMFVIIIGLLGGPLMFIPLAMIAGFALLGFLMFPRMKRAVRESGRIRSERHAFLVEMLSEMRAIKQTGSEAVWAQRYRDLSAAAASGGFATAMATAVIENISQMLMTLAGASVLVVGAVLAADGELSIGALIAIMALIWRILGPIKTGFTLMHAAEQTMASIAQLNAVLGYTSERRGETGTERKVFSGRISFQHVVFRHPGSVEPSLFNVSISVQPGELVAVAGRSGSGKTTLLRTALGLDRPQTGAILLDDIDSRQVDPIMLRHSFGYLPQRVNLFYGSIEQNLRLGNPLASAEDLERVCMETGLAHDIERLPEGLMTRIGDHASDQLPTGFAQRLGLARAFLADTPILLLDEPVNSLDETGDRYFMEALGRMRGRRTVLFVTHRPSHMRLADNVVFLNRGRMEVSGPPDEVVPAILKAMG